MARQQNAQPSFNVVELAAKLYDADSDIRYMSLSDLRNYFDNSFYGSQLSTDYTICAKLVDGFLHTLNDPNGEVQNQTIKCIGPFVNKMHPNILCPMIHKFTELQKVEAVDPAISALAVRAIVISLPRPSPGSSRNKTVAESYAAISKVLIPRLIGHLVFPPADNNRPPVPQGLLEVDLEKGQDSNSIDVLTEVARCFGSMLHEEEIAALQQMILKLLESTKTASVLKKKAVVTLTTLSHYFSSSMLSAFVSHVIEAMRNPYLTPPSRRLYIIIISSLSRAIPSKFGPHLRTLAPFVLAAVSQEELDQQMQEFEEDGERDTQTDEVREAALIALETFLTSCGAEMEYYLQDCIDASLRFIKYDPLIAGTDGDDADNDIAEEVDETDEFELDEDFEQDTAGDDEDDVSWKVRRCAAKTLHTIISVSGRGILDNEANYDRITFALVSRFKEREESVRLEILSTLSFLIRQTGEEERQLDLKALSSAEAVLVTQPQTRKRRRGNSDVSMTDIQKFRRITGSTSPEIFETPSAGSLACLAKISQDVVGGLLILLRTSPIPTKQASICVLRDLILSRQGSLDNSMNNLLDLVITAIKPAGPASATSMNTSSDTDLRVEALRLLAELLKAHSSKSFQAQFPKLTACVTQAVQDKSPRLACEALHALEQLIKALTPPRSASAGQKTASIIGEMCGTLYSIISAKNVDLAVRQQAIQVLGIILGRTMATQGRKLISESHRSEAFDVLYDSSRNETTRYASIKAINAMALQATDKNGFDTEWLSRMCLELGAQLRKADRSLRGASLETLKTLVADRDAAHDLDSQSIQQLAALIVPLLTSNDLHLISPALVVLATMVKNTDILTGDMNKAICELVSSPTAAPVIDQVSMLAQSIGERQAGADLMKALLKDVGVAGNPSMVGKVIGTLLVFGMNSVVYTVGDFLEELEKSQSRRPGDDQRSCLALSVLGEVGSRLGSSAHQLSLQLFTTYFSVKSDEVVHAAASALGRAAAGPGNVKSWVPAILNEAKQHPHQQYLLLISIRELLRHNENDKDVLPFTGSLWDLAVSAARTEDNRTIGAECLANLVMVDPDKYLPALQSLLSNQVSTARGTAILAFRDIFTISDHSYDKDLRPVVIEILTTMMRDLDVDNRRASLNTFNAAARNKSGLILPHLYTLMPLIIDQSYKDPSLIREVSMGPFKHTVDDGLEVRKNAYETLYSLMDIASSRMDVVKLYDRVIAGIGDDRGIQTLCNLMITKLMVIAPDETLQRLEAIAEQFRAVLAFAPKENAVRPEFEKADEAKKGVIKVSLELDRAFPNGSMQQGVIPESVHKPHWAHYLAYMRDKHSPLVKDVERRM